MIKAYMFEIRMMGCLRRGGVIMGCCSFSSWLHTLATFCTTFVWIFNIRKDVDRFKGAISSKWIRGCDKTQRNWEYLELQYGVIYQAFDLQCIYTGSWFNCTHSKSVKYMFKLFCSVNKKKYTINKKVFCNIPPLFFNLIISGIEESRFY